MMAPHRQLGDKLGPRLAQVMTEATIAARAKMSHHEAKVRQAATQALIDRAGHEIADLYRPLVHAAIDAHDGTMHPHLEEFLRSAASGTHQWQAIGGLAMGGASGALSSMFANALAPVVYPLVALAPNLVLDPNTLAAAVAAGLASEQAAQDDAAKQGYGARQFQILTQLAQSPPALAELQALVNRGFITENDGIAWLRRQGIAGTLQQKLLDLRIVPLSPADAADMVVRSIISPAEGRAIAAQSGVSSDDFDNLVLDTGEPPSVTDLAMAFRRGIIDRARFVHGILQSRVRNEWVDVLEQVQFAPMSVSDAVTAAVQGYITDAQLAEVANVNGLMPQYVSILKESAGEPISKTEVYELLRRGKISQANAIQAIKESRIKDKYIPDILNLVEQVPAAREVATLYSHGALTLPQAEALIAQNGYPPEVQKAFLDSAVHGKVAALKNVTLGQVSRLYVEGIISWTEGEKLLAKTGYQPAELIYTKEILDNQRLFRNRESAIGKIKQLFVSYHIDKLDASAQLDALHVQSGERDHLLAYWEIERTSNARILTEAQIVDAWEFVLITAHDAVSLLEQIGYPHEYAVLLLEIKAKGPIPELHPGSTQGGQ